MRKSCVAIALFIAFSGLTARAQQPLSQSRRYDRILCVVPMIGKGTWDDPRRPMFTPTRSERSQRESLLLIAPRNEKIAALNTEIVGYRYEVSDDGRFALVEFQARSARAFDHILARKDAGIKIFQPGRSRREEVEAEFRKHKKDFDWKRFWGVR